MKIYFCDSSFYKIEDEMVEELKKYYD